MFPIGPVDRTGLSDEYDELTPEGLSLGHSVCDGPCAVAGSTCHGVPLWLRRRIAAPRAQMLKCSTAQMLNCSDAQMLKCSTAARAKPGPLREGAGALAPGEYTARYTPPVGCAATPRSAGGGLRPNNGATRHSAGGDLRLSDFSTFD